MTFENHSKCLLAFQFSFSVKCLFKSPHHFWGVSVIVICSSSYILDINFFVSYFIANIFSRPAVYLISSHLLSYRSFFIFFYFNVAKVSIFYALFFVCLGFCFCIKKILLYSIFRDTPCYFLSFIV